MKAIGFVIPMSTGLYHRSNQKTIHRKLASIDLGLLHTSLTISHTCGSCWKSYIIIYNLLSKS